MQIDTRIKCPECDSDRTEWKGFAEELGFIKCSMRMFCKACKVHFQAGYELKWTKIDKTVKGNW